MNESKDCSEKILYFFENRMIFLNPKIKMSDLAAILGVSLKELKVYFKNEMDYSFLEMLNIFRATHARKILMEDNIPYKALWRASGYKSYKDFERGWEKVVN